MLAHTCLAAHGLQRLVDGDDVPHLRLQLRQGHNLGASQRIIQRTQQCL